MEKDKRGRIGIVLEGGGTRGAYHAGALRALEEQGIFPDALTGTSIGAINAAALLSGKLDQMEEIYNNFDAALVFFGSKEIAAALSVTSFKEISLSMLFQALSAFQRDKGIDITPLLALLKENIDEKLIRESPVDFGLVGVNISDRKVIEVFKEEIPEGKLVEYVLASSALPGFRIPSETKYLDGGIHANVPLDLLLKKGPFEAVYVIRTRHLFWSAPELEDTELVVIAPSSSLGSILQAGTEHVRENRLMGYYDTVRILQGLQGKLYCITGADRDTFYQRFISIRKSRMESLGELFGCKDRMHRRSFFEMTLPLLAEILGIKAGGGYQEIGTEWMERVALSLGIDRYRIVSEEQLFLEVNERLKEVEPLEVRNLGKLEVTLARFTGLTLGEQSALLQEAWRRAWEE